MSSSLFAFVPRKVAKSKNNAGAKVNPLSGQTGIASSSQPTAPSKGKGKETIIASNDDGVRKQGHESAATVIQPLVGDEEVALVWLALSDYALWADGDLRRRLEVNADEDEGNTGEVENEGCILPSAFRWNARTDFILDISFNYVLNHSPILSRLKRFAGTSQTPLMKAVRTSASHLFDLQLIVTEPQPWFNRNGSASSDTHGTLGGYRVRRKNRQGLGYTKRDWDERTVYMEHIPIECRDIPSSVTFILSLLPKREGLNGDYRYLDSLNRVQHVTLPPHHHDTPGTTPKFKGFALVTFLELDDARHFLQKYPWSSSSLGASLTSRLSKHSQQASESALKFGFRTLSKHSWEQLRSEYIAYGQTLVQEINRVQDQQLKSAPVISTPAALEAKDKSTQPRPTAEPIPSNPPAEGSAPIITHSSPYPYGCLVFIKNIHSGTNKTTLKSLFGPVLASPSDHSVANQDPGIDYVDFNKGMDSCHLRVSLPTHAEVLSAHFGSKDIAQKDGLDDTGCPLSDAGGGHLKAIAVEIVRGTRESMYWQKVPDKVKRAAVEKALKLASGSKGTSDPSHRKSEVYDIDESSRAQKKRRKR
ncbi:hypothetical protein FA15DRAFT_583423 [Coprinopsis marcescibilis]|uniref:XRRM domain-containing protein n=1 Tax=Coprinopsis marcescibilis TaxID=230819 RepID=A0A5C3L8C3_COPMA|nr:hypothetical protein FA15DRAFT_583423 [Coprinopsis marcescibilis]